MPRRTGRSGGPAGGGLLDLADISPPRRRTRVTDSVAVTLPNAQQPGPSAENQGLDGVQESDAALLHTGAADEGGTELTERVNDRHFDDTRVEVHATVPDVIVSRCSVI